MTKKKIVSVLLSVIMMLSALSVFAAAEESAQLPVYGGANEEVFGSGSFNAQISGDTAAVALNNVGSPTEVGKMLANFWSTENPDGMMIDMNVNGEDLTTFELSLGEGFTTGELLLAVVAYLDEDGTRGFTPLGLIQSGGSATFDNKSLDHLRIMVIPDSLSGIDSSEAILEAADKFKNVKFIAFFKITPANDIVPAELPEAQWLALQNALSHDATLLYMVQSELYMEDETGKHKIENNSGVTENVISDFFSGLQTQNEENDLGNISILHVSEDGKTVTKISNVERVYDDLVFRTHLMGEFFIVDSSSAPVASEEPELPSPPVFLHSLQLNTSDLLGATASLDKYEKLLRNDKVILTVTPGAGREFIQAPVAEIPYANISEPLKQADGSYIFEISNVAFNQVVNIKGEAVIDESKKLGSIEIKSEPQNKTYYWSQSALDTNGLVVEAFYADGTSAGIIDNSLLDFDGFDSFKLGKQEISVDYNGLSDTFEIEVEFNFIECIKYIFNKLFSILC